MMRKVIPLRMKISFCEFIVCVCVEVQVRASTIGDLDVWRNECIFLTPKSPYEGGLYSHIRILGFLRLF